MSQTSYMLGLLDQTEYATGADASHWKGDWNPVGIDMEMFQSVLDFMILRAGYGAGNGLIYKDTTFDARYSVLEQHSHILRGAYWYFSSQSHWQKQWDFFVAALAGKDFDFLVMDFEKYYNVKSKAFADGAVNFMIQLKQKFPDKQIIFYANRYDYQDWMKPYSNGADSFPYWVAQYPWRSWMGGLTDWFKSWWSALFVSGTKRPYLPSWLPQDHWELWQVVDNSGIGQELGFESDELDFNVSRRKKDAFIEWIGAPARWEVDEEPVHNCDAAYQEGFAVGEEKGLSAGFKSGRFAGLLEAVEQLKAYVEGQVS